MSTKEGPPFLCCRQLDTSIDAGRQIKLPFTFFSFGEFPPPIQHLLKGEGGRLGEIKGGSLFPRPPPPFWNPLHSIMSRARGEGWGGGAKRGEWDSAWWGHLRQSPRAPPDLRPPDLARKRSRTCRFSRGKKKNISPSRSLPLSIFQGGHRGDGGGLLVLESGCLEIGREAPGDFGSESRKEQTW